ARCWSIRPAWWARRWCTQPMDPLDGVGGQRLRDGVVDRARARPRRRPVWVAPAYPGGFNAWVEQPLGWTVTLVRRPRRGVWGPPGGDPPEGPPRCQGPPRRWVVARTLGGMGRWRRTRQDYAYLPATSEGVLYAIMGRVMLRRLAQRDACALLRHPLEQFA